ncbi:MAG: hypothetical protein WCJ19_01065 [bacterium]
MPKDNQAEDNNIINAVLTQWGNFCNICGAKRSSENIKIIRRTSDIIVLHINCSSCKNGHFITFSYNSAGFTMQQYASDLRETELDKLGGPVVSMDDLIDFHITLEKVNNSADLMSLLSRKK